MEAAIQPLYSNCLPLIASWSAQGAEEEEGVMETAACHRNL